MQKIFAQIFVFILSLYIVIGTMPIAYAASNPTTMSPQELALLRIQRQQEIHNTSMRIIREGGKVPGYGGYKGEEVVLSGKQPITVTNAATNATVATLEAEVTKKAVVMPTVTNIAKSIGRSIPSAVVTYAVFKVLDKAVDYVLDPANSQIKYAPRVNQTGLSFGYTSDNDPLFNNGDRIFLATPDEACQVNFDYQKQRESHYVQNLGYQNGTCHLKYQDETQVIDVPSISIKYMEPMPTQTLRYDTIADKIQKLAKDNDATAQDGIKATVQDMITNNEIDNSYFNDSSSVDNSTDIINNFITNNYPNSNLGFTTQNGQTTVNPGTQVTNMGDTTNYTTNNTITNNDNSKTTTTTTTTVNNTTQNITNISITNNTTNAATAPSTKNPTSSTEATSAPQATSAPIGTSAPAPTKQTESKPFELPAFCDWAKPVCSFIDWVEEEPGKSDDGEVKPVDATPDFQKPAETSYVEFGGSCPAPVHIPISFMGASRDLEISYVPFCNFAVMIKPAVLMGAWISALMIIAGGRSKE